MNIRVPKSSKGYKVVAETFGQRYMYVHVHVCDNNITAVQVHI